MLEPRLNEIKSRKPSVQWLKKKCLINDCYYQCIIINNHSFIDRGFQTLHKTEIFIFLSCFFLPQKETEICSQDKKDRAAPSWYNSLLFRSPCLYWGHTGVSVHAESKESAARTF